MARTGRPRNKIPRIKWDVYVRQDLAAQVELLLADPMRERVKYGARGELIESLLEKWLEQQRAGAAQSGKFGSPDPEPEDVSDMEMP